jgi:hypothetical protein
MSLRSPASRLHGDGDPTVDFRHVDDRSSQAKSLIDSSLVRPHLASAGGGHQPMCNKSTTIIHAPRLRTRYWQSTMPLCSASAQDGTSDHASPAVITKTRSAGPHLQAAANIQRQRVILSRLSYRIKVACQIYGPLREARAETLELSIRWQSSFGRS